MESNGDFPKSVLESRARFGRSHAEATGQSVAVVMIGLDGFEALSDTLGHAVVDEVFERAAERMQSALRKDDRLTRLPPDGFVILLDPAPTESEAGNLAKRLADLLQRAYLVQNEVVNMSACMGIVLAPEGGLDSDTLFRRGGIALKCAKACGPGTVQLFDMAMEDEMVKRHALTNDLRKALLLRQLEVHYQPQVDIKSQSLTGFEALLRWRHPQLGLVSPGEFIPLAEELGLIGMIGEWVLRTACKAAARLPAEIVMAVNASPLQLQVKSFSDTVERALGRALLPAHRLEVEITEGVLLKKGNAVTSNLNDLSAMGVRLAMDDFGTGYSSLGQLANLPFNTIKIDRSLVGGSVKQRAIVRAISTLGDGLGMATLAEGIETTEQLAKAHSDGCRFAQGYLFGKAAPASEFDAVLERFSPAYANSKRSA